MDRFKGKMVEHFNGALEFLQIKINNHWKSVCVRVIPLLNGNIEIHKFFKT